MSLPTISDRVVTAEPVTVEVGGERWGGWESVEVEAGLEQAARSFSLAGTLGFPGQSNPVRIRPGAACVVRAGDDVLVTGWVDRVGVAASASSVTISLTGRSRTADAVDCSVISDPPTWRGKTIAAIAAAVLSPYGLSVEDQALDLTPIDKARGEVGATPFEVIERIARTRGLAITDDEEGRLVLTRAGLGLAATALRTGPDGNVLEIDGAFDASQVYGEYIVKGQRAGTSTDYGSAIAHAVGVARDDAMPDRRRVLVLQGEGRMDGARARSRAIWEAATRAGKSVEIGVRVQGWRQDGGALWRHNARVRLDDDITGVHTVLLTTAVRYAQDSGGTICGLTLAPLEAFMVEEPAAQPAPKKARTAAPAWDGTTTKPAGQARAELPDPGSSPGGRGWDEARARQGVRVVR